MLLSSMLSYLRQSCRCLPKNMGYSLTSQNFLGEAKWELNFGNYPLVSRTSSESFRAYEGSSWGCFRLGPQPRIATTSRNGNYIRVLIYS